MKNTTESPLRLLYTTNTSKKKIPIKRKKSKQSKLSPIEKKVRKTSSKKKIRKSHMNILDNDQEENSEEEKFRLTTDYILRTSFPREFKVLGLKKSLDTLPVLLRPFFVKQI